MKTFMQSLATWCRGFAQLRHPELVRLLGEMRFEAQTLERLRRDNAGAKLERGIVVMGPMQGQLSIGTGSTVCRGTVLSMGDGAQGHGRITIGENSWVGQYNNLRACEQGDIRIGSHCLISQFCTLVSSNHGIRRGELIVDQEQNSLGTGVVIQDDVWLGAGVVVLPGVTIGAGTVVGANAVVTHDVPGNEVWAGNPAQRIAVRT
jgi:acetyltransferase-like isoleucine patch superfamily enzyme